MILCSFFLNNLFILFNYTFYEYLSIPLYITYYAATAYNCLIFFLHSFFFFNVGYVHVSVLPHFSVLLFCLSRNGFIFYHLIIHVMPTNDNDQQLIFQQIITIVPVYDMKWISEFFMDGCCRERDLMIFFSIFYFFFCISFK